MNPALTCNVCAHAPGEDERPRMVAIPCDVRRFQHERFVVWRCVRCDTIHARDHVELAEYYRDYPFLRMQLDWPARMVYRKYLRRLTAAGLTRQSRILDYGCGSGTLISYLRALGYHATGYDAYSDSFDDRRVLERQYDCVIAQDVIEHVDDPLDLLDTVHALVRPSGLIVIGTPDAGAIDLERVDQSVHMLHLPYHRHILSTRTLHRAARSRGWEVVKHYDTVPGNTLLPGINLRFFLYYLKLFGDCLDVAFEPARFNLKLLSPTSIFLFFFGSFFCPKVDVTTVFRRVQAERSDPLARRAETPEELAASAAASADPG